MRYLFLLLFFVSSASAQQCATCSTATRCAIVLSGPSVPTLLGFVHRALSVPCTLFRCVSIPVATSTVQRKSCAPIRGRLREFFRCN